MQRAEFSPVLPPPLEPAGDGQDGEEGEDGDDAEDGSEQGVVVLGKLLLAGRVDVVAGRDVEVEDVGDGAQHALPAPGSQAEVDDPCHLRAGQDLAEDSVPHLDLAGGDDGVPGLGAQDHRLDVVRVADDEALHLRQTVLPAPGELHLVAGLPVLHPQVHHSPRLVAEGAGGVVTVYERPGQLPGEGSGQSVHSGSHEGAAAGLLCWGGEGGTNEGLVASVTDCQPQPVGPGLHQVGGQVEAVDSVTSGKVWV